MVSLLCHMQLRQRMNAVLLSSVVINAVLFILAPNSKPSFRASDIVIFHVSLDRFVVPGAYFEEKVTFRSMCLLYRSVT